MDSRDMRSSAPHLIAFGALIIGALMVVNIHDGHRDGFLFALGSAMVAWIGGHAMLFYGPRVYWSLFGWAVVLAIAATARYWPL